MNVLLLPATTTAEAVAKQLVEWSAMRLLRPFCAWPVDDPEGAEVQQVTDGDEDALTLAGALARADPATICFTAVLPAAAAERIPEDFAELVERCLRTAARVVDFEPARPLTCTLAVVPADARQAVPPQLFRAGWDGVYVTPEDRAEAGAVNLLVGDEPRFVRHAAHAVATLAELWTTPADHSPDLLPRMRATPAGPLPVGVRVVRCFTRAVELGHIADHVAEAALGDHGGWPRPDAERYERADEPGPIVEHLARRYVAKHEETLAPRDFEPVVDDEQEENRLNLLDALRALWEYMVNGTIQRSLMAIDDALGAVHDLIAARIERLAGPGAGIRVKRWHKLLESERERGLLRIQERLEGNLVVYDGPVRETWLDLRLLALGLVDGSDLPTEIGADELVRAKRRIVICDPALIAHDHAGAGAGETDADAGGENAPAPDEEEFAPLLEQIHDAVADALAEAETKLAALASRVAARSSAPVAAQVDVPRRWWRRLPRPRLPRLLRRRRPPSTLRRLARRARWLLLLALVAIGYAKTRLGVLEWLEASVGIVTVYVGTIAVLARQMLRRPRITDDPEARRALDQLNEDLELAEARADVVRLRRRLRELDDWIEILAELLHRPWVREPFGELELIEPADPELFPAAFGLAVARPQATVLARIGSRARAYAFRRGWLTNVYRHVEHDTMREWVTARRGTRPPPDPAEDTSVDRDSPRRALHEAVLRGDGRRLRESPLTAELLSSIDEALLDELAPAVLPAGEDAEPAQPTTTWIAPPTGVADVVQNRGRLVVAVGAGSGVVVGPRLVLTAANAVTRTGPITVERSSLQYGDRPTPPIPVEKALQLEHTPLALLHLRKSPVRLAVPDSGPVRRGAAVVALDVGDDDAVEHRWGFVSRTAGAALFITYEQGSPRSGAPVFDLAGRLVAVQISPERAYRIPDLVKLLSKPGGPLTARARGLASDPVTTMPASAFLQAIAGAAPAEAFSPGYWRAITDANEIALTLPAPAPLTGAATRIDQLTNGAAFMRPLRVMVHRVESTRPIAPSELDACQRASREWLVDEVDAEDLPRRRELVDPGVGRVGQQT